MTTRLSIFGLLLLLAFASACDTTQPIDPSQQGTAIASLDFGTVGGGMVTEWNLWMYGFDFDGIPGPDDLNGDGVIDEADVVNVICQDLGQITPTDIPVHFTIQVSTVEPGGTSVMQITPSNALNNDLNNLSPKDPTDNVLDIADAPPNPDPNLDPLFGYNTTGASDRYFDILGRDYIFGASSPCPPVQDPGVSGIGADLDPDPDDERCSRAACRNELPFEFEIERGSTVSVKLQRSDRDIVGLNNNITPTLSLELLINGERVQVVGNVDTASELGRIEYFYTFQ